MHPGIENLSLLTDIQIEQKIAKLSSVYFITPNDDVRQQIILLLDSYKIELEERRLAAKRKQQNQDGKDDLDNLIKIS